MKRYSMATVRAHLADALDEVEKGAEVVIERRGVRFRLVRDVQAKPTRSLRPLLEVLDPGLEDGWTWVPGPDGQLELVVGGRTREDARKAMARERKRRRPARAPRR